MRIGPSAALLCLLTIAGLALGQGHPASQPISPGDAGCAAPFTPSRLCEAWGLCSTGPAGYVGEPGWELRLRAEYLLWWAKEGPLETPLVTTGSVASQGILGVDGTQVLFGGEGLDFGEYSGGRFTFDLWLDQCQMVGIQGSAFFFGQRGDEFDATGNALNGLLLARPFLNANTGAEDAQLIASPGAFEGSIRIGASSQLWGAEGNVLVKLYQDCACRLDFVGGARYLQLDEQIRIFEHIELLAGGLAGFLGAPLLAGDTLDVMDGFDVRNEFYGGQLGLQGRFQCQRFVAQFNGKVALGSTREVASIIGATLANGSQLAPGGLLALPTNIDRYQRNEFAVVPEIGVRLGYCFDEVVSVTLGYNFLYWSQVVRPGDQIDRTVNTTQVPKSLTFVDPLVGPARPVNAFPATSFWAQGLTVAVEFRY